MRLSLLRTIISLTMAFHRPPPSVHTFQLVYGEINICQHFFTLMRSRPGNTAGCSEFFQYCASDQNLIGIIKFRRILPLIAPGIEIPYHRLLLSDFYFLPWISKETINVTNRKCEYKRSDYNGICIARYRAFISSGSLVQKGLPSASWICFYGRTYTIHKLFGKIIRLSLRYLSFCNRGLNKR